MIENSDHHHDDDDENSIRYLVCFLPDPWKHCCILNFTEKTDEKPWPHMRRNLKIEYNKA
jgi:hypothetical protein